jgi:hypothetical protein
MRNVLVCLFVLTPLSVGCSGVDLRQAAQTASVGSATQPKIEASMTTMPMRFERNVGQTDSRVSFLARGGGYAMFLTPDELVLSLRRTAPKPEVAAKDGQFEEISPRSKAARAVEQTTLPPAVLRMRLESAGTPQPVGEDEFETKTNYFIGNDPAEWHTDVPNFARVRYAEVYDGIDLVYYGKDGQVEFDFEVAPGADPSSIVMAWEGADSIEVAEDGGLVLKAGDVELQQHAPVLYQQSEEGKRSVAGSFAPMGGGRVAVTVGAYDASKPLVIDPVLVYSYTLDGSGFEMAADVAVDSSGAAYIVGETSSNDFPTFAGCDPTFNGGLRDVFVAKMNPAGSSLTYSTYVGGYDLDVGVSIAVDASGAAFVGGYTGSDDFPTIRSYDNTYNGDRDTFVAKLGPLGDALVYSTFVGGSEFELLNGLALDSSGGVYLVGSTVSSNFPTANAYDSGYNGGGDVFVTKLKPFSPFAPPYHVELAYSTYLGRSDYEKGFDIAVDSTGAAFVAGGTWSTDFPRSPHTPTHNGQTEAFVAKLSPSGGTLSYSTLLGGSQYDCADGIAVDAAGSIYVSGSTTSTDFPTSNAYDASYNGAFDLFVAKLRRSHSVLTPYAVEFSTYLGGSSPELRGDSFFFESLDDVSGIGVDSSGDVYVVGSTYSTDYPTANAYDSTHNGETDIALTKLRADGSRPAYSTFLGGADYDSGRGLTVTSEGTVYVAGSFGGALVAKLQ